ncbi:putative rmlC-like cupin domain superfamily, rmlC-like jelly roll protein [Helianthus anomalus]
MKESEVFNVTQHHKLTGKLLYLSHTTPTISSKAKAKQGQNAANIFNGFTPELIVQSFNVDQETPQKLQGQNDQRGHIVNVGEDLQIVCPPQEQQQGRRSPRQQQE